MGVGCVCVWGGGFALLGSNLRSRIAHRVQALVVSRLPVPSSPLPPPAKPSSDLCLPPLRMLQRGV